MRPVAKQLKERQGEKRKRLVQGKERQRTWVCFVNPGVVSSPFFRDIRLVRVEKPGWKCLQHDYYGLPRGYLWYFCVVPLKVTISSESKDSV